MKINVKNTEKLNAAILNVEGPRAKARTITAEDIQREAERCEESLQKVIYKGDMKGAVYSIDIHAQQFASSYEGVPAATVFTIERGAKEWFVTAIERTVCRRSRRNELTLTDAQKSRVLDFVTDNY